MGLMNQIEKQTIDSYSFLWDRENKRRTENRKTHFEIVQDTLNDPIVRNRIGLEVGCGTGFDLEFMAKKYPDNKIIAIDFSSSIFSVNKRLKQFDNIQLIRASALDLPFKDGKFDFVYSFGVLHHTIDPEKGICEINRILRDGSVAALYLYENHEDNKVKFYALKCISFLRRISTKMPNKVLYLFCILVSPMVFILLSLPAKILNKFGKTKYIADKIPFNFGRHPFNLIGDLFDRLSTPIEFRFGENELTSMLLRAKFNIIKLNKIPDTAGWVVMARK